MRSNGGICKKLLLGAVIGGGLAILLEVLRMVVEDGPFSWDDLAARWAFIAGLLLAAWWTQPCRIGRVHDFWPWPGVLGAIVGVGATLAYIMGGAAWAAWIFLGLLYLLLLGLDAALARGRAVCRRWGTRGFLALAGGIVPACIAQIESHFADEEFFVALQVLALSLFSFLLLVGQDLLTRRRQAWTRWGLLLDRRWLALLLVFLTFAGLGGTVRAYQRSFYPPQAPSYEGISSKAPFLCGEAPPESQTFDGTEVFYRLLARVESNPRKGPPEYGMLALGTGEQHWAQAFRRSLMEEAAEGRFSGPAHSVKWIQYEAALRAYYFPRVCVMFPALFSSDDLGSLQEWFEAINHRALTTEWVDWMYALAFAKRPEGPYENQENGAGLLALLESGGLAAPDLSSVNRSYLAREQRGWADRFRNTDDALKYQLEWINNAYFQSLYAGGSVGSNAQLSFEWLLLQALPDGAPVRYNHPSHPSLAGVAYLGASLLRDPHQMWLAGRALDDLEMRGGYLFAQPGAEQAVSLAGRAPTQGSCLLYGDSGLPTQVGPLAPDKIVLRDGWSPDSAYVLLNLRFTGWHRYKATNTITLVYQDGSLAGDELNGETFAWLPAGRSMFRDKRVPRENLSGLLVEQSGMSDVLRTLIGIGSAWAQDPPNYAEVVTFDTGDRVDLTHTRLVDWRGWQHDRWVYLYHRGGPVVVVDEAQGPPRQQAALAWNLVRKGTVAIPLSEPAGSRRIRLRGGDAPAEVLLVPLDSAGRLEVMNASGGDSGTRVVYYDRPDGRLRVVTVFLLGRWVNADARWEEDDCKLWIEYPGEHIVVPLPESK